MKNRIIQLLGGVPRSKYSEVEQACINAARNTTRQSFQQDRQIYDVRESLVAAVSRSNHLEDALRVIAACETPNSNGTVRKMAKIAREALQ